MFNFRAETKLPIFSYRYIAYLALFFFSWSFLEELPIRKKTENRANEVKSKKYESAFTFLIDLFLEARAEILQIFQLLFWVN